MMRNFLILSLAFWLSISRAYALEISLSDASIDRYFQILEQYVLPLMVVSTVVLFCGYLASRVYHRTVSRRQDGAAGRGPGPADDQTEAFLRELKSTPPIEDREPVLAPRRPAAPPSESKPRAPHPLLRRRAAARAGETKPNAPASPVSRRSAATTDDIAPVPAASDSPAAHARETGRESGQGAIPRLQAAFRRPRDDGAAERDGGFDDAPAPYIAPPPPPPPLPTARPKQVDDAPRTPVLRADAPPAGRVSGCREDDLPPPVRSTAAARADGAEPRREEPTISVVQALKGSSESMAAESETARARAGEIVDSLDYIASVLQQGSVMLGERLKNKQRLTLEDVRTLRVNGFDEPQNVLEDLRKLGGDAAQEVLTAFAAVSTFNKIVQRLEQMAEQEPLDDGWNDLVRARISETIYAVGQVRKTLGIYRRVVKKPANSGAKPEAAGGTQ